MTPLKFLQLGALAGVLSASIAGSSQAATVMLTPVLGASISGSTALAANEKIVYKFDVPTPYNFKFSFTDGIAFTTSGQAGDYIETFTNGPSASTGDYTLATAVPEPATWALMIMGFGGVGALARRRSTANAIV